MAKKNTSLVLNDENISFSIEGFPKAPGSKNKTPLFDRQASITGNAADYIFTPSNIQITNMASESAALNGANGFIKVSKSGPLTLQEFNGEKAGELISSFRYSDDGETWSQWKESSSGGGGTGGGIVPDLLAAGFDNYGPYDTNTRIMQFDETDWAEFYHVAYLPKKLPVYYEFEILAHPVSGLSDGVFYSDLYVDGSSGYISIEADLSSGILTPFSSYPTTGATLPISVGSRIGVHVEETTVTLTALSGNQTLIFDIGTDRWLGLKASIDVYIGGGNSACRLLIHPDELQSKPNTAVSLYASTIYGAPSAEAWPNNRNYSNTYDDTYFKFTPYGIRNITATINTFLSAGVTGTRSTNTMIFNSFNVQDNSANRCLMAAISGHSSNPVTLGTGAQGSTILSCTSDSLNTVHVSGDYCFIASCVNTALTGDYSAALACDNVQVQASRAVVLSSTNSTISLAAQRASLVSATTVTISGGSFNNATASYAVNLSGIRNASLASSGLNSTTRSALTGNDSALIATQGQNLNYGDGCIITASASSNIAVAGNGEDYAAVLGSENCSIGADGFFGSYNVIIGSTNTTVSRVRSVAIGTLNSDITALYGNILGGAYNGVDSSFGSIINSRYSETTGGTSNDNVMVLNSRAVSSSDTYSTVWGYHAIDTVANVANKTARIDATTGTGYFNGGTVGSGADYAEYFRNMAGKEIPMGTILVLNRDGVAPYTRHDDADDIIGVVSNTAVVIGNENAFAWSERYLKDEFGGYLTEEKTFYIYEAGEKGETEEFTEVQDGKELVELAVRKVRVENPNYDPEKASEYISRSDRPDEWTLTGLMGQLYVRVYENITSKYVDGFGKNTESKTPLRLMKMSTPFDPEKGYGVALCLLK